MVLDPEKIQIEIFLYHGLLCKGLGYGLKWDSDKKFKKYQTFDKSKKKDNRHMQIFW